MANANPPPPNLYVQSLDNFWAWTWDISRSTRTNLLRVRDLWRLTGIHGIPIIPIDAVMHVIHHIVPDFRHTAEAYHDRCATFIPRRVPIIDFELYIDLLIMRLERVFHGVMVANANEEDHQPQNDNLEGNNDSPLEEGAHENEEQEMEPQQNEQLEGNMEEDVEKEGNVPDKRERIEPQSTHVEIPPCPECKKRHHGKCLWNKGVCYNCREPGHIATYCPKKKENRTRQGGDARLFAFAQQGEDGNKDTSSGEFFLSR